MVTALVVIVGGIFVWVLADRGLIWLQERQHRGPSTWHGQGPGTTFHSSGFEDTVPPHEVTQPAQLPLSRGR